MKKRKPLHVAIVMDGNGRWAERQGLPRIEGHKAGVDAVRLVVKSCLLHDIPFLSLFAFSSENWQRPVQEVEFLMGLFLEALAIELPSLKDKGVRLCFTGDRTAFSQALQQKMSESELSTQDNNKLTLNIMMNYGGQWDITQAVSTIVSKISQGMMKAEDINSNTIANHLATAHMPHPDLFIRTSGEQRISNFYLWQLAYTELYFTDIMWPDFNEEAFLQALLAYASRERRFGLIGDVSLNEEVDTCLSEC